MPPAILGGFLGLMAIIVFISAIRLSYRIEARSDPARHGNRRLRYTNIWAVALNIGVARDAETQGLRLRLLARLGVVALLFAAMGMVSMVAGIGQP